MAINTKAKGSRAERKCRDWLAKHGFKSTKAGASLGTWDLIAINSSVVLLIQCKVNRWPRKPEMDAMEKFDAPWGAIKLIVRYDDGCAKPRLKQFLTIQNGIQTNCWAELTHKDIIGVGDSLVGAMNEVLKAEATTAS